MSHLARELTLITYPFQLLNAPAAQYIMVRRPLIKINYIPELIIIDDFGCGNVAQFGWGFIHR